MFGFNKRFWDLIFMLVSSAYFLVLVDGSPTSFFNASRGLRQGDLISPILFVILAKCLGRFVNNMVVKGEFVGLNPSSSTLVCSRQQFVDISIVMGEASVRNVRNIKKALSDYGMATSQIINWSKSVIYFINVSEARQNKIKKIIGCESGSLPRTYLGLPLGLTPPDSF